METSFTLGHIIEKRIRELKISSLDISFNELANMYSQGELIIQPDYQRTFRWDIVKQSRFIESLLMEMPIPPVYVIELEDGRYELIDGLQRISSYLNYRGFLKGKFPEDITSEFDPSEDEGEVDDDDALPIIEFEAFPLQECDIITELNGLKFSELQVSLQLKLKRRYIRMEVLRKGINPELKYHMFKRLNTGGEKLEQQEIRNCTIRLIDSTFMDFIIELSKNTDFLSTIKYVSRSKIQKKFSEELVLRFFAFKNDDGNYKHDVSQFLTNYMERVALADAAKSPCFDYEVERKVFKDTFKHLNSILGKEIFSTYRGKSSNLTGFNIYQYEAITCGIQSVIAEISSGVVSIEVVKNKLLEIKKNPEFVTATVGGGKNSIGVYKIRLSAVRVGMEELKNGL